MQDPASRFMAFFAVVAALLNSGMHFQRGDQVATLFFMIAAILVTIVTSLNVRKGLI
jgi:hypothetical protein